MYQLEEGSSHTSKPCSTRAVSIFGERSELIGRVLVVEDNPITQLITLQQLRELGCDPCVASFGSEALESRRNEEFQLILMDCHLPDKDGYEIARAIRRSERGTERERVPIVAVTVDSYLECAGKCISAGMDGYLQKPTSVAALREILATYLK